MREKNSLNKTSNDVTSKYVVGCFFSHMHENRLDKDISWTYQRLYKKELHSFTTSGNNNQLIQCHMPNKIESLEKSCENFNFSKRLRGLQEDKYVFREFISAGKNLHLM